ncbi:helix-turn-helix domain-containing protein, partial [Streptomyces asiaticus]|uniref:helix-turn-helix domain-containing protein n=1 Tax=Streptomyces asiaticus TaxID=114695 RepID=UPI001BA72EB8
MADPLDLCDLLKDGERIVHLRVRVGKSRATVAADLGWHPDTYREWETRGHAPDKMTGPRGAGKTTPAARLGLAGEHPVLHQARGREGREHRRHV